MEIKCRLEKRNFTTTEGITREYYVLVFKLIDGSTTEVPLKGDKAKLILFSLNAQK